MRRSALLLLVGFSLAGCATPPRTENPLPRRVRAASTMAEDLRRDLFAFADDSMLGRSAETPNAARAARFIAAKLKRRDCAGGDSGGICSACRSRARSCVPHSSPSHFPRGA